MVKRIFTVILFFSVLLTIASCDKNDFFGHAELRIALDSDFREFKSDNFDAAYTDGTAVVGIYRISYNAGFNQGIPDFLTPAQFAAFYMERAEIESEVKDYRGTAYYEYTRLDGELKNSYIASFYRSKYAYFIVLFATPEKLYPDIAGELLSYTETVIFVY